MPILEGTKRGIFKKILLDSDGRKKEAKELRESLLALRQEWKSGASGVNISLRLLVLYLTFRFPNRAFLSTGRAIPSIDDKEFFLSEVRFFGIPDCVRRSLCFWLANPNRLQLREEEIGPESLLDYQANGKRVVAFFWDLALEGSLTFEGRDALEHLLHDLSHAWMFFREDYDPKGQIAFFQKMQREWAVYLPMREKNEIFKKKSDYCISDMNSHPAHLEAYWNAICREAMCSS